MKNSQIAFNQLQEDILACHICAAHLPLGPRPVFQCSRDAHILIAGQAPGKESACNGYSLR